MVIKIHRGHHGYYLASQMYLRYTQPITQNNNLFSLLTKVDLLRPLLGLILGSPFYKSQCDLVDTCYTIANCIK